MLACVVVAACSSQSISLAGNRGGATTSPVVSATAMPAPNRICEPLGWVASPDGRWIAYLRRAEWEREGFQIPYLLTELWVLERGTGVRRRVLDYTQLSREWSRGFVRNSAPFGRAGGFTFRELSWSPNSKAIALEEAGDDWVFRGSVIVDLARDRIIELPGGGLLWSSDGSRAVLCSGLAFDCPDGLLLFDLQRGEVRRELAGTNVVEYGWSGTGVLAVLSYVKDKDRYGWWEYDPQIGPASLRPIESPTLTRGLPATITWWAPEPNGQLPCHATGGDDSKPLE